MVFPLSKPSTLSLRTIDLRNGTEVTVDMGDMRLSQGPFPAGLQVTNGRSTVVVVSAGRLRFIDPTTGVITDVDLGTTIEALTLDRPDAGSLR